MKIKSLGLETKKGIKSCRARGWNTVEVYVNGFSTSLPEEIQLKALRTIKGFEKVKMFRPGYAIEYDYFPPTQLKANTGDKAYPNLFFAGQINGTTGYEEAACQGLIAGINSHNKINEKESFVLGRSDAYIGVLIDDLINKEQTSPIGCLHLGQNTEYY